LPVAISGQDNSILGTGNITGAISLQDSDTQLNFNLNGTVWQSITLNDSIITLGGDLQMGGDSVFEGSGILRLLRYHVVLGGQDAVWTSTIAWQSFGGPCPLVSIPRSIDLHAKTTLSGIWDFQDACVIDGHGNILYVEDMGAIIVNDGARLYLRNVILETEESNCLYCTDDTSEITFDNVTWLQDSDITFTKGRMRFINTTEFLGTNSFIYDSSQTSTINTNAVWKISNGMKFYVGRKEANDNTEPLYFGGTNSTLKLDNCTFIVTG